MIPLSDLGLAGKGRAFANLGYAFAIQDCRGRWDSEGEFAAMRDEGEDGFDTCEWLVQQAWCNGKIGTMGSSYLGWVQWSTVAEGSSHLKCIAPSVIGSNFYAMFRPGGALLLNTVLTWSMSTDGRVSQNVKDRNWTEVFRGLPLPQAAERAGQHIPHFVEWAARDAYDEYWKGIDFSSSVATLKAPALLITGWYDLFAPQTLIDYEVLRSEGTAQGGQQSHLVVGPWAHAASKSHRVGEVDFGFHSLLDLDLLHFQWFDLHLRGNRKNATPPVKLFIMGINEWREEETWPLSGTTMQKWFLHSGGTANSLKGDGSLSPEPPGAEPQDTFIYDPHFPVQTVGGANCCDPQIVPWGPYDQRAVEMRNDVLCYTSAPMIEDLTVIGQIKAVIYASSDAPDTDWTVKLLDVWPNGYAMLLCDGIVRARFREGYETAVTIEPGKTYRYEIVNIRFSHEKLDKNKAI